MRMRQPRANQLPIAPRIQAQPVFAVEPYFVQTLQSAIGKRLVVETTRGAIAGTLVDCKPDHAILKAAGGALFLVRIAAIAWITPH